MADKVSPYTEGWPKEAHLCPEHGITIPDCDDPEGGAECAHVNDDLTGCGYLVEGPEEVVPLSDAERMREALTSIALYANVREQAREAGHEPEDDDDLALFKVQQIAIKVLNPEQSK